MQEPFRLLTFDGGGVRGLLSAHLVERICTTPLDPTIDKSAPVNLLQSIDCFAGTSTGALLAAGYAAGKSPAEMCALFEVHSAAIFTTRRAKWKRHLLGPPYDQVELEKLLKKTFDAKRLQDLSAKLVIVSLKISNNRLEPRTYHNFGNDGHQHRSVVDVLLESTAAPTYFKRAANVDGVDGGLVANNPTAAALAQCISNELGTRRPRDMIAMSIGTGAVPREDDTLHDASSLEWMKDGDLISTMIDGGVELVSRQVSKILHRNNFHRIQPVLPHSIQLDDVSSIAVLKESAARFELDRINAGAWPFENKTSTLDFVRQRMLRAEHVPAPIGVEARIRELSITQVLLPGEVSMEHRSYAGVIADANTELTISTSVADIKRATILIPPRLDSVSDPDIRLNADLGNQNQNQKQSFTAKFPRPGTYSFSITTATSGAYPSTLESWHDTFPGEAAEDFKRFTAQVAVDEFGFRCIFSHAYALEDLPYCLLRRAGSKVGVRLTGSEWNPHRSEVRLRDIVPGDVVEIRWKLRARDEATSMSSILIARAIARDVPCPCDEKEAQ